MSREPDTWIVCAAEQVGKNGLPYTPKCVVGAFDEAGALAAAAWINPVRAELCRWDNAEHNVLVKEDRRRWGRLD